MKKIEINRPNAKVDVTEILWWSVLGACNLPVHFGLPHSFINKQLYDNETDKY